MADLSRLQQLDGAKISSEHDKVLSPLMRAKSRTANGEKVNACPFGCTAEDLDDNGYCDHLVGFTRDGRVMEPMLKDHMGRRWVNGSTPFPVHKTDKLVRITIDSRVYRAEPESPQAKKA